MDPRTPVIVGAAITNDRTKSAEPIDLMIRSIEAALVDSGIDKLRARIDSLRVVWGVWPYADPGRLVAKQIGCSRPRTTLTTVGGNQTYDLLADTATRIVRSEIDAAVICGAESLRTRRAAHAAGRQSNYLTEHNGAQPDEVFGSQKPLATPFESEVGVAVPTNYYALAENANRLRRGEPVAEHRKRIAELWAVGSQVAADNPHAWLRDRVTATEIAADSPNNRPIAHPYPKMMTSNLNVDQSGALIICAAEVAKAAGVPRDRWVFPWSGVGANDSSIVTRWQLDASPAMRIAGGRALQLAGVGLDGCAYLDLYSCFPIAVQVAQAELNVASDRDWTISGGLTFAAGPLNCYCLLSAVRAVELLRTTPNERAFLTGNGGYFSRHSFVVLGGSPPSNGFQTASVQAMVDAEAQRLAPDDPTAIPNSAELEAFTIIYDRSRAPTRAITSHLALNKRRYLSTTENVDTIAELLTL